MADVVGSAARPYRQQAALSRRRRDDRWVAVTALIGSVLALPLAQSSWHGPEVAAVLAVSATAMLAGQRWAIALVAFAELLLAPTVAAHAFSGGLELWPGRVMALAAFGMTVPGLLALRRAAAAMVLVTGRRRTSVVCRRFHAALVIVGVIAGVAPLL